MRAHLAIQSTFCTTASAVYFLHMVWTHSVREKDWHSRKQGREHLAMRERDVTRARQAGPLSTPYALEYDYKTSAY